MIHQNLVPQFRANVCQAIEHNPLHDQSNISRFDVEIIAAGIQELERSNTLLINTRIYF